MSTGILNLCDSELRKHKILLAVIFVAAGTVLTFLGINGTVTFLTGAASGYLVKEMFTSKSA
jgi:hypothetical protein